MSAEVRYVFRRAQANAECAGRRFFSAINQAYSGPRKKFLSKVIELRGESFHIRVYANHLTNLSTVQSYLRGD